MSDRSRAPLRARLTSPRLLAELGRFLVIGGAGFVTDVGLFTLLRSQGLGLLDDKPLTAKVISAAVATGVTWLGNRSWTWRHRETASARRELVLFTSMNVIGIGISLLCLAVSHYALGLRSLLADQVSANGVGLVLGTTFRFLSYRYVVFRDVRPAAAAPGPQDAAPSDDLLAPEPSPGDHARG